MPRGFVLLEPFLLLVALRAAPALLDVALRAVPLDLGLAECGAFFTGVFLPEPGARVVIVSDLAMAQCSQVCQRP